MKFQSTAMNICAASLLAPTLAMADISDSCQQALSGERLTVAVPNSPGGGYDTYARALAPSLEKHGNMRVRVTNMPAGGGLAARSYVMNADDSDLALLIENVADTVTAPMGTVGRGAQAEKEYMIAGYEIVGVIHSEPSAWIGRAGLDVRNLKGASLVAAEGSTEEALLPFLVVGEAMGVQIDIVAGYEGTSEMTSAILRGEADISSMSLTTSYRRASDEGVDVLMVLSDGSFDGAPGIPHLAGEGSVVWELTKDMDPQEATRLRGLATSVARLRGSARGMFISTNVAQETRNCMAELMDAAIADPEFVATAESQGRPVASLPAAEARSFVEGLVSAHQSVLPTLTAFEAELRGN